MPTGLGLRPVAKAPDEPPNPTGYAPPLDSTKIEEGEQETAATEAKRSATLDGRERVELASQIEALESERNVLRAELGRAEERLRGETKGRTRLIRTEQHRRLLLDAIGKAKTQLILVSAWIGREAFDEKVQMGIVAAMRRGVEVRIAWGAALLRRGVFVLFMGLFARGCVSPVLISGGQQPSQRVPASFRRPAEPRNGAEHRRSVPLRRAPFWTFTRRSGTVPWEGRQACDGCDDRIPATYIRRAANRRPLHRSPEPSPVRSGRCCLRGCQSPPLVQRSPADERERTRTGTAPAAPGFGTQAPARTSRPTQPERGCWSGRGHQRCRVLGAARARKPRRNGLRHDAGCGSGLRAARSRRLASARCRAEPAAGALLGRDAPPRDHRDRLAGTTAYALEATVVLDIIHVAAATRRAVLVVGSSKGLSAFGPRPDGSRPAHGDTWLQLRRFSAAAGSRSLDAY